MMAWTLYAVAMCCGGVEAAIAPDYPAPCIYVDDPLILELRSDETLEARVQFEVKGATLATPFTATYEKVNLRADQPYWRVIDGFPATLGRYEASVIVEAGGATENRAMVFCRIERPVRGTPLPLGIRMTPWTSSFQAALRHLGVAYVTADAGSPEFSQQIAAVMTGDPRLALEVSGGEIEKQGELLRAAAPLIPEARVARWQVNATDGQTETLRKSVEQIRQAGAHAPVTMAVETADQVKKLYEAGAGQYAEGVTLLCDTPAVEDIRNIRAAVERAGYEGVPIYVASQETRLEGKKPDDAAGALIQGIFRGWAGGAAQVEAAGSHLFDNAPKNAYVYISAMTHRLGKAALVGPIDLPEPSGAVAFRNGSGWLVAVWPSDPAQTVKLTVGDAKDLALMDARGNVLEAPAVQQGVVSVSCASGLVYLTGWEGNVLAQTAWAAARTEARAFVRLAQEGGYLPADAVTVADAIAKGDMREGDRLSFFTLLQAFPVIEAKWHAHEMPRNVAAPAGATLGRLARFLCTAEQGRGEPFLETMDSTLKKSREYQSRYLTGTAATTGGQTRGDALLASVERLTTEAEQLKADGWTIEADAVAALAEWRARALDSAQKADPLHAPDAFQPPPPPPPAPEVTPAPPAAKPAAKAAVKPSTKKSSSSHRRRR